MEVKSVARAALEYLRKELITGGLEPGQKLNEIELASELGISRHPLREAFRILDREGLVRSVPRIGTFVTEVSQEDFENLSMVREMLECKAIEIIKDLDKGDFSELERAVETANDLSIPADYDVYEYLDCHSVIENFHLQLVASTNNSWMLHLYQSFSTCIARYQFFCLKKRGVIKESIKQHNDIYNALIKKDFSTARNLLKAHIYRQEC